ncbi:hypothetical protein PR001_g25706 [Phytophthora rubi]|uniref:Secreted protein n=1 Tax=Phytophthora rubi TaxID=129364 RepID=A0A6A3I5Z9_9STRA|nr:hypothetical protein PR001_g25706 [Phytophthora rubi]KAE8977167.1 hypothetical protein PR002_g25094 [Phytophthora rubi]
MAVLPVPVLVASLMCCCRCQLPAWSVAAHASCPLDAGASCRLCVVLLGPAAGLVSCCRCQLPVWSAAAGAGCRLRVGAAGASASG